MLRWLAAGIFAFGLTGTALAAPVHVLGKVDYQHSMPYGDPGLGPLHVTGSVALNLTPDWFGEYVYASPLANDPLTDLTVTLGSYTWRLSEAESDYFLDEQCCFDGGLHSYPDVTYARINVRWTATVDRPSLILVREGGYFMHEEGPNYYFGSADWVEIRDLRNLGAVPEPATWALMMIGFGGLGSALRRRARRAVA
ncbi:MAG: PEPxxWA-CTERM sorting domain-containing protein [Phenylobacterium sp.]|uniref:PEPxxWA-CTERM sorting domain-containing protein n=1 Tax=Phenylobacterium sp. TaxID=1871053 RepID=UPI001A285880|nr:PEPxxWA-CTERM sorting domain-containing protein [Phenylobacterium sp.]MBJ7408889.1 PEPxxWA-CTERM sorting domain-containing protein [Phenylobacterium sp.]